MTQAQLIANSLRQVYFGGNWTSVNFKTVLADCDWQKATHKMGDCNTIAVLLFHSHYYIKVVLEKLKGGEFNAHDKYSFAAPVFTNNESWLAFVQTCLDEATAFCEAIAQLDDALLPTFFIEEKYGTYHRNLTGIIEHCHYHLGQIALLKKLIP